MESYPKKPPLHHFVRVYVNDWNANHMGVKRGWPKLLVNIESSANLYRVLGADESLLYESDSDFLSSQPLEDGNACPSFSATPCVTRAASGTIMSPA